ncbi:acyl-CoA dehydrogenase family protein [Tomitella gaofuii]|uniref:acyl-CoA dehydrogenase family protein n=1 Tax=Tomitella gaofuii TaxID=2760083 RepID=UPI0015F9D9F3|nr:acyl-CoA dehydrogenase family protein [Tomitella gaofuii]
MDLTFTDEQAMLADTVRRMCQEHAGSDAIRATEADGAPFPPDLWRHLAAAGLLGLGIGGEFGGAGAGLLEWTLLAEELGRAAAPLTPILSGVLAARILERAGSPEQRAQWLPRLAEGTALVSVAWLEPGGDYTPERIALSARRCGERVRLQGAKTLVPFAAEADAILVPTREEPSGRIGLFLVPNGDGVRCSPQRTLAGEPLHFVDFDLELPADARIGEPGDAWETLQQAMAPTAIVLAAYAAGGARRVLEMATAYATERHQFGRPIGANQGISHPLADTLAAVEAARTLMHQAAWCHDAGRDHLMQAMMAKQRCCAVFRAASMTAHQVYGGIGFTLDVDVQLFSRRAKQLQLTWWDDAFLSATLGGLLLDDGPGLLPALVER